MSKTDKTSIDLETQYEMPSKVDDKAKKEKENKDKDEPLEGLSGTRM